MTTKDYDKLLIEDIKDILLSDYPLSLREQLLDDILEDYIPIPVSYTHLTLPTKRIV